MPQHTIVRTRKSRHVQTPAALKTIITNISPDLATATSARLQEQAKARLLYFKDRLLDPYIKKYFAAKRQELTKNHLSKEAIEMLGFVEDFVLRSGKRFRSALLYYMYLGFGGKEKDKALQAAMAMEFLHSFLLIHDDIIDQDQLRRGSPSMHYTYETIFQNRLNGSGIRTSRDAKHFGISMAICAGDILMMLATELFATLDMDKNLVTEVIAETNRTVAYTGFGEMIETYHGLRGSITKKEIFEVYDLKTATYTMRCPIMLAAILAKAPQKARDAFEEFAWNLGIAFQIQDDIIGMFGTQEKIGKPVGSDIKEGQETLLIHYARNRANRKQKAILKHALCNPRLTFGMVKKVRDVVRETGALDYCKQKAVHMKNKAWKSIQHVGIKKDIKEFLAGIADYLVSRAN